MLRSTFNRRRAAHVVVLAAATVAGVVSGHASARGTEPPSADAGSVTTETLCDARLPHFVVTASGFGFDPARQSTVLTVDVEFSHQQVPIINGSRRLEVSFSGARRDWTVNVTQFNDDGSNSVLVQESGVTEACPPPSEDEAIAAPPPTEGDVIAAPPPTEDEPIDAPSITSGLAAAPSSPDTDDSASSATARRVTSAAGAASAPTELPATGTARTEMLAAAATGLVVLGGVLVLASRRRHGFQR